MNEFIATDTEITSHLSPVEPLQPQLNREKPQKVSNGWQKLLVNAEKVNQLSAQLEEALFALKVTASEIKGDQNTHSITNRIFQHKLIVIPCIHYKRPGVIVVTTRKVDLFQQEREALQLAQMLRSRTSRRLRRPIPTTLSKSSNLNQSQNFVRQLFLTWQKLNLAIGRKPAIRDYPRGSAKSDRTRVNKAISC